MQGVPHVVVVDVLVWYAHKLELNDRIEESMCTKRHYVIYVVRTWTHIYRPESALRGLSHEFGGFYLHPLIGLFEEGKNMSKIQQDR